MRKTLISFALASLFLSRAPGAAACDASSCPLTHRKTHSAPWELLVEKSFGLPGGFGKALMTETEWAEQQFVMAGMSPGERQTHKNTVKGLLLEKAKEKGMVMPVFGQMRQARDMEVVPFRYGADALTD